MSIDFRPKVFLINMNMAPKQISGKLILQPWQQLWALASNSAPQDGNLEHAEELQHVGVPGSLGNGGWNSLIIWAGVLVD